MSKPVLTEAERLAVDQLKHDAQLFLNCPRRSGKSRLAAIAVAEMADEMNGITVRDALTGTDYFVPPGTPWEEALPARIAEECDHEWKFVDESFDHEFGTERVHFWRCEKCGATKDAASSDYDQEDR